MRQRYLFRLHKRLLTGICFLCKSETAMSARVLKVGIFLLLLAAMMFVADVLSPATPIPIANVTAKLLLLFFCILMLVPPLHLLPHGTVLTHPRVDSAPRTAYSRKLSAVICTLRC